ncbi:inositol monophosphatase [Actinosynnema sp. NPDC020468]|uniref:inositol monophosphatase family protein n=1 Tax=Actinosynnema sp. NPDC020468 TaxID=3154488 RepID=UPI00340B7EDC
MLTTVIDLVEDVARDLPALQPTTPPADLDDLMARFAEVDAPIAERLLDRLGGGQAGDEWSPTADGWVVDALDGAVTYLQGLPQWCVSVTLVREGEPVLAVLHAPALGETYAAEAGRGAWRDGRVIAPSAKTDLRAAVAATSQPPALTPQPEAFARAGAALPGVLARVAAVRNLGPTSWQVADVASGRLDFFWEYGLDAGNLLGGALIAREAGAVVTTVDGRRWTAAEGSFLVAGPGLHAIAQRILC